MAAIKNAIDELLQAASPRTESVVLPSNIKISTSNLDDSAVTPVKTDIPAVNPTTGNLADDAFLSTTGYVKASGSLLTQVSYAGNYGAATGQFITPGGASSASEWDVGVWGQVNGTATALGKIGVIGIADQSNGYGVVGESSLGKGVYGESASGAAVVVDGIMEITDSTMVLNLNAHYVGGVDLSGLVRNNEVDLQYSTDGGGSWNPIRFKPA
ncbi:MAG: hypothetical protein M0Q95_10980 [Porticoccaceae bacterium]|nr:hypothetical protein [Porticoccaceae bacterium]